MIRGRAAIVALTVLAAALGGSGAAGLRAARQDEPEADSPDRGTLAVLRRDGLLIPFASVNKGNWSAHWPTALRYTAVPITMDAIPRQWWGGRQPQSWRVWLTTAPSAARPLTVGPVTTARVQCRARVAFRTDYRSPEPMPPPMAEPFPKDGLAIGGGLELEPIELVDEKSPERPTMASALLEALNKAEESTVRTVRGATRWRHPVETEARKKVPVRIESWYRAPLDEPGWSLSYVEAVRSYPPGPEDEGCGLETLFSGWVFSNAKGIHRTNIWSRITYCDRVGALYMMPFGRVRTKDREHWVFQMSGWDQEWYTVAQVSRRDVRYLVEFLAGTRQECPVPQ